MSHVPASARLVNGNHRIDTKYRAAINKLSDVLDSNSTNVITMANVMVVTGNEQMRARLMDFAIGIILAEADAYVYENDNSRGPSNGILLADTLNNMGISPRP